MTEEVENDIINYNKWLDNIDLTVFNELYTYTDRGLRPTVLKNEEKNYKEYEKLIDKEFENKPKERANNDQMIEEKCNKYLLLEYI